MGKSLYDILDLDENATAGHIKNAYLRLKHRYEQGLAETDKNHISNIQYQAICEAYAVLSDSKRRELYDQKLITGRQRSYIESDQPRGFPILKAVLLILFLVAAGLGWKIHANNQAAEAKKARELKLIEIEKEHLRLQQEEARLAAENAQREREEIIAAQQDARARNRSLEQARYESQKLAQDSARAEAAERRREEAAQREQAAIQREQARQEAEWQRREQRHRQSQGPAYIMR